ncbi:hypothetical protein TNCV_2831861 [Trichonephila clavipes]|nr:hypothetical protein TNCV_2831861 [Trichonephila clavipes]
MEREKRWETPNYIQGVLPLNWGEIELNRSVTCRVLKATANDMRPLARGLDLAFAVQVALVTTITTMWMIVWVFDSQKGERETSKSFNI